MSTQYTCVRSGALGQTAAELSGWTELRMQGKQGWGARGVHREGESSSAGLRALLGEGAWLHCLLRADAPSSLTDQHPAHLSIGQLFWGWLPGYCYSRVKMT